MECYLLIVFWFRTDVKVSGLPRRSLFRLRAVTLSQVQRSQRQAGDWKDTRSWTWMWNTNTAWHETHTLHHKWPRHGSVYRQHFVANLSCSAEDFQLTQTHTNARSMWDKMQEHTHTLTEWQMACIYHILKMTQISSLPTLVGFNK